MKTAADLAREQSARDLAYWRGRMLDFDGEERRAAAAQVAMIEAAMAEDARITEIVRETGSDVG